MTILKVFAHSQYHPFLKEYIPVKSTQRVRRNPFRHNLKRELRSDLVEIAKIMPSQYRFN
jgi:hypothetical protein